MAKAVRLDPAVPGKLTVESDVDGLPRYVFTPSKALKANTRYTLIVDGVTDRRRRPRRADRHGGQDVRRPGGRSLPTRGAHAGRGAAHGYLGALQPEDGPRLDEAGLQGARGRQADQGQDHVRREQHGPGLRPGEVVRLRHAGRRDGRPIRAQRRRRPPQVRRAGRVPHGAEARGAPSDQQPGAKRRILGRRRSAVAPSAAAAGRRSSGTTWAS